MNREFPYIILALIVIVAAALFIGNSDPIGVVTGQAEANTVLSEVPAGGWIAKQFLGALFKIVLSGIVLGIAGVLIAQARKWLRDRQFKQKKWNSGPNAQWQQQTPKSSRQPKMTTEQMLQLAMLERLTPPTGGERTSVPRQPFVISQQPQAEEKLDLRF